MTKKFRWKLENPKIPKNGRFLVFFWLILSVLRSKSYDFNVIAHTGAPLGVE